MEDFQTKIELLINSVELLEEEKVLNLARELLDEGMEPIALLGFIKEGMNRVGQLYETKDYYIADLIMAGLIFKQVLELDKMTAHFHSKKNEKIGKVVLGTVKGDIHDIGKEIVRGMLEVNGFEVVDLGVDVSKDMFLEKVNEYKPDILALSGVLTYTVDTMKEIIDAFTAAGLRDEIWIIIGGNHLTKDACKYIGADNFANDATVGVRLCKELIGITGKEVTDNDKPGLLKNI